jgi:hypothetical protein
VADEACLGKASGGPMFWEQRCNEIGNGKHLWGGETTGVPMVIIRPPSRPSIYATWVLTASESSVYYAPSPSPAIQQASSPKTASTSSPFITRNGHRFPSPTSCTQSLARSRSSSLLDWGVWFLADPSWCFWRSSRSPHLQEQSSFDWCRCWSTINRD